MNSWPINSDSWSCVLSNNHGYLVRHIVSTKFMIVIDCLSLYCATPNHPITGWVIVTDLGHKLDFPLSIRILKGPINSTNTLFHVSSSANLSCNLLCFLLTVLYVGNCHNLWFSSGHLLEWQASINVGKTLLPSYPVHYKRDTHDTISLHIFGVSQELLFILICIKINTILASMKITFLYILRM